MPRFDTEASSAAEGEFAVDHTHKEAGRPAMLTVHDVAGMLSCSARTVYRLTDSGRMPRPVKLGALIRWPREAVTSWITQGCPRAEEFETVP